MKSNKKKLGARDSVEVIVEKMGAGDPSAMLIVRSMLREGLKIDAGDAYRGFGCVHTLDALGIYGVAIWNLYSEVCGLNIITMLGIIKAHQLGYLSEADLVAATCNGGKNMDVPFLLSQVKDHVPYFAAAA